MPSKLPKEPVLFETYNGKVYHPVCYRHGHLALKWHSRAPRDLALLANGSGVQYQRVTWSRGKSCAYCKGATGKPLALSTAVLRPAAKRAKKR